MPSSVCSAKSSQETCTPPCPLSSPASTPPSSSPMTMSPSPPRRSPPSSRLLELTSSLTGPASSPRYNILSTTSDLFLVHDSTFLGSLVSQYFQLSNQCATTNITVSFDLKIILWSSINFDTFLMFYNLSSDCKLHTNVLIFF